jgi:hypothetical protein
MTEATNKLLEVLSSVVKPSHFVLACFCISTLLLLNPYRLSENLAIAEQVEKYRFYFFFASSLFGLIVLFSLLEMMLPTVRAVYFGLRNRVKSYLLPLGNGEKMLLLAMEQKRPNSLRMNTEHPSVIELRKHGLIEYAAISISSDFQHFKLTRLGCLTARRIKTEFLGKFDVKTVSEFLQDVTGLTPKEIPFKRL